MNDFDKLFGGLNNGSTDNRITALEARIKRLESSKDKHAENFKRVNALLKEIISRIESNGTINRRE